MLKKIIKRILLVLFLIIIFIITYEIYKYIKNYNSKLRIENNSKCEVELQKELLNNNLKNAQNFVETINNNVALTLLRTNGELTLSHDKTPNNNKFTEWLLNSDILIYAKYNAAFTIETSNINVKIDKNNVVNINYTLKDIELSLIDITDFNTSENKSIFGSSYTPKQIAALEKITRDTIMSETNRYDNILMAQKNLESYYMSLADNLNVIINIIEY